MSGGKEVRARGADMRVLLGNFGISGHYQDFGQKHRTAQAAISLLVSRMADT
jgi:hypothetical protein